MNALTATKTQKTEIVVDNPRKAEQLIASLPLLRGSYPKSKQQAIETRQALDALDKSPDPRDIARLVTSLKFQYFVGEVPDAIQDHHVKIWITQLSKFPIWAIEAACEWWVSKDNPKRGIRPLPGDIAERAETESAPIRAAEKKLAAYERHGDNPPSFYL